MELKEKKLTGALSLNANAQDSLLKYIENKNETQLEKLLSQRKVDINCEYGYPHYKTALLIACSDLAKKTNAACVKLLLKYGADPRNLDSCKQQNALHFAAEGSNVEIVKAIIEKLNDLGEDLKDSTVLFTLLEYIFYEKLDESEYIETFQELLKTNIDVNYPDIDSGWTVAYMAAKYKFEKIIATLIEIKGDRVNFDSFRDPKGKTARDLIEENKLNLKVPPKSSDENSNFILPHLSQNVREQDSQKFKENYVNNRDNISGEEKNKLLFLAIREKLKDIVEFLIDNGADVNKINTDGISPLEVACRERDIHIVKVLTTHSSSETICKALIDLSKSTYSDRDQEIYDEIFKAILISDKLRINFQDDNKRTCLHYAARYKSPHVTLQLLKNGASLASKDDDNKLPIADMTVDTVRDHLDQCIYYKDECRECDEEACLIVDLRSIIPPRTSTTNMKNNSLLSCSVDINSQNDSEPATGKDLCAETDVLQYMCDSTEMKKLLKHPVILAFLYLKWHRIQSFFYINFAVYNLFLFSLLTYVSTSYEQNPNLSGLTTFSYVLLMVTFLILVFREISQLVIYGFNYFLYFENWLEIVLINVTMLILIRELDKSTRPFVAIAIVAAAIEFLLLIGHFPAMSTHIMMLRTVSYTFFKLLIWYSILLIAFAYSFYILFQEDENEKETKDSSKADNDDDDDEEQDFFLNPGMSLLKTIIMLTGEFDAGSLKFNTYPIISQIIFAMFVFLIAIVLFNLLNGLAVSDTQTIKSDAELYGQIIRVEHVAHIERVLLKYNIAKWLPKVREVCMFPLNNNETKLYIFPNQYWKVFSQEEHKNTTDTCWFSCKKIYLDIKTERSIRSLLDEKKISQTQKQKEADVLQQIISIKKQMKALEELLKNKI